MAVTCESRIARGGDSGKRISQEKVTKTDV